MSIVVEVVRAAVNTVAGTQDFTTSNLGGLTPVAAMFLIGNPTADGTGTAHAIWGMGATSGSGEQWAWSVSSEDALGSTNTNRRGMSDQCIAIIDYNANTVDGEAAFDSFITNGVRINWGDAPADAYLMTVWLFAGTGMEAHAGIVDMPNVLDGTVDITAPGFAGDVLITGTAALNFNDTGQDNWRWALGCAVDDGSDTQRMIASQWGDAKPSAQCGAQFSTAYASGLVAGNNGQLVWAAEVGSWDASGFTVTNREAATPNDFGYLFLSLGGEADKWLGTIATPTTIGTEDYTGPGFQPQAVIMGLSHMLAVDTGYNNNTAGSMGVSGFSTNAEYSLTMQHEDGASTSNAQAMHDDTAINLPEDDQSTGIVAAYSSMLSTGFQLNFSNVMGSATQCWALVIGTVSAGTDYTRSVADSVGITDALILARNLFKTLTDSIGIADALTNSIGRIVILADSINIADILATVIGKITSLAESVGITDSITTARNLFKTLTDTINITDIISIFRNLIITLTESVNITDIITKIGTFIKALTDPVGITDSISALITVLISIADTVGITDTISNIRALVKILTDPVAIADTLTTARNLILSIIESVGITDTIITARDLIISIANSVGMTDAITAIVKIVALLVDSVGITDTVATIRNIARTLTESVSITDALTNARNIIKTLTNSVSITDAITSTREIVITIADTTAITDVMTAIKGLLQIFVTLIDNVGITDVLSKVATLYRTLTNSINVTDTMVAAGNFILSIADGIGITDIISRSRGVMVALADTIGITSSIITARNLYITFTEAIATIDALNTVQTLIRVLIEAVPITDTLSKVGAFYKALQDTISIGSISTGIKGMYVTLADSVGVTDVTATVSTFAGVMYRGVISVVGRVISVATRLRPSSISSRSRPSSVEDV